MTDFGLNVNGPIVTKQTKAQSYSIKRKQLLPCGKEEKI